MFAAVFGYAGFFDLLSAVDLDTPQQPVVERLREWFAVVATIIRTEADEVIEILSDNLGAVFGLLGFVFGLWRWWRYRERVLFRRLEEYLDAEERRLRHVRGDVFNEVLRPGIEHPPLAATVALPALRRVLDERGWVPLLAVNSEIAAHKLLIRKTVQLREKLRFERRRVAQLEDRIAAAELLAGVICAGKAGNVGADRLAEFETVRAIEHFDAASRRTTTAQGMDAAELKAQLLLRSGRVEQALEDFSLLAARCRQSPARAIRVHRGLAQCRIKLGNPGLARRSLRQGLNLFAEQESFDVRDQMELAAAYEDLAAILRQLGASTQAAGARSSARQGYDSVAQRTSPRRGGAIGQIGYMLRRLANRLSYEDALFLAASAGAERLAEKNEARDQKATAIGQSTS